MIKDNKVTAEAVAGAELCQCQMHLVHARRCGINRETGGKGGCKYFVNDSSMNVVFSDK